MSLVVAFVLAAVLLMALGYSIARARMAATRRRLRRQRTALLAEWQALNRTAQVRSVVLDAQRTMQREAQDWQHRGNGWH